MPSAVVNTMAITPTTKEAFAWFGPRISFSHDAASVDLPSPAAEGRPDAFHEDFEFLLHDRPVAMLPADELFSEGKLVPLHLSVTKPPEAESMVFPDPPEIRRKAEISGADPYGLSPRAPRCIGRWRELLGLKRASASKFRVQVAVGDVPSAVASASSKKNAVPRSAPKHLLHWHPKAASVDSSFSLPLLRDSDQESSHIASRLSHSSSSSSGPDHEDIAGLSIDSDKIGYVASRVRLSCPRPALPAASRVGFNPSKRTTDPAAQPPRAVSADSPRMSSSGKIVFHGLERSSSSPGSFTGGPRPRMRRVERSYSANVQVAPVLNVVPVGSLRGSGKNVSVFGLAQLFSPQPKKERQGSATNRPQASRPSLRHRRQDQDRNICSKSNWEIHRSNSNLFSI